MNKQALNLFFKDKKNKRTLDILTDLLDGSLNQNQIAKKHGVVRQTISEIKLKYLGAENNG